MSIEIIPERSAVVFQPVFKTACKRALKITLIVIAILAASTAVGGSLLLLGLSTNVALIAGVATCAVCAGIVLGCMKNSSKQPVLPTIAPVREFPKSEPNSRKEIAPTYPPLRPGPSTTFLTPNNLDLTPIMTTPLERLLKEQQAYLQGQESEDKKRSNAMLPSPPDSIGPQTLERLRTIPMTLIPSGTPGVDFSGTDATDRENVAARVEMVRRVVQPHAHTKTTDESYEAWVRTLSLNSLAHSDDWKKLIATHQINQKRMIERFGKPQEAVVVGMGPVGLINILKLYRLGYRVRGFEQYLEESDSKLIDEGELKAASQESRSFAERLQPFSLVRQIYWSLREVGIPLSRILHAFGDDFAQWKQSIEPYFEGWAMQQVSSRECLGNARATRIGQHTRNYVPNALSLPVYKFQDLAMRVIREIQAEDKEIQLHFNHQCTQVDKDLSTGRFTLIFNHQIRVADSDLVVNAAGGKINALLGFTQQRIAKMHGLGVFFPPHAGPNTKTERPLLSRAVRPFASLDPQDPVYVNMELFPDEIRDENAITNLLNRLAIDMGYPIATPRKHFTLDIDLSHVTEPIALSRKETGREQQIVLNIGDSLLKPHFITASGANFGLLTTIGLNHLLQEYHSNKISLEQFAQQYSELGKLMQKQSAQMVVNLFGKPLKA